jgi:putative phosphoribosyl transferase
VGGFADRRSAGDELAGRLEPGRLRGGVVVGLARGGVIVAAEVAARLGLPLDALAVRKVGHPENPEYGIGAVTPGGTAYVRSDLGLDDAQVHAAVAAARADADALDLRLHAGRPAVDVAGRPCVLVDDGLATGATMVAAARWARAAGATHVVVAVPVGPRATLELIAPEADEVICVDPRSMFFAVGETYDDFHQVSDAEVAEALAGTPDASVRAVVVDTDGVRLAGDLTEPNGATGVVVFVHGSGSSRRSPRNRAVAARLNQAGLATFLFDLLTPEEEAVRANVFDIDLLARRLVAATSWVARDLAVRSLPIGYFGASTGAAAALWAAADDATVRAIVSRGGRPDLAGSHLEAVRAPTLLIVGGADTVVLDLNRRAAARMRCERELVVVDGATHLFEEPGALEQVSEYAIWWFARYFTP